MKMKKVTGLLAMTVAAVMAMTGCGGNDAADGSTGNKVYHIGIIQQMEHGSLDQATKGFEDKLTELLVAEGAIHAVRLKQKSKTKRKKKITAAIYEYQADCDGEWGEISVDFENGTAEIIRLADWDTIKTNWFANEAIRYILSLSPDALKKYMLVPLEPLLIS